MNEFSFRNAAILVAGLAVGLVCSNVLAESIYITDKISIDVHSEKFAQGDLTKSLPSGTLVEVLQRDQGYTQIRTRDNFEGWVESKYLTNEKPTQIDYLQLAVKYRAAQDKIQDYETRLQELRNEAQSAEGSRNKVKHSGALRQDLKLKDITIAELKITVADLEEQLAGTRQQLDAALQTQATGSFQNWSTDTATSPSLYNTNSSVSFYTWLVLSLAVTLIIGVLLGFVLVDYKVHKKQSADVGLY
ncbi:MAG TPA: TIGR04211 family SH3 domain-containing protein [Gammaproteobacteria bacterium]